MNKAKEPSGTATPETGERRPLPRGWRWVKLGDVDVCKLNPRRPANLNRSEDAPTTFVPMPAVDEKLGIIARPEIRPYGEVKKGYTCFAEGDVLFAKITPCMQNGKHAVAKNLIDGIGFGSTEFHVIRPGSSIVSEWIHMYVRQPHILEAATAHFTGAVGQQRVPDGFLTSLELPLPPLAEQKRIASILAGEMEAVEKARAAAEAQLDAARALPAAYLRSVFESPEAKKWPTKRFGDIVDNFDGKRIPVKLSDRRKGPYPYYGASGIIDHVDGYLFDGEYLLIGEDGANLVLRSSPIAFKASGKFWVNNHAHIVQPKDDMPMDYLLHFFAVTDLKPYVTGAAQPKLTQDDMNSIQVPIPPKLSLAGLVQDMNEKTIRATGTVATIEEELAAINALPAALLRRAFQGEL